MIFSGKDVLRFLEIPYPPYQDEQVHDLSVLSHVIQTQFSSIDNAFSDENLEITCQQLSRTGQGNLDEIRQAFLDASGFE